MARSSSRPVRVYKSKVDMWLVGILVLSLFAALSGVVIAGMEDGFMRMAQAGFIMLGVMGFVAWIFLDTAYTLDGRDLIIRSGPFRWRIAVDEITSVESGPALSMDRLEVVYGKGKRIAISPADKEKFLADLRTRQGKSRAP